MVRRIRILGSLGSGKTYIARLLSRRLSIPAFHLDNLYWVGTATTHGVPADAAERDRELARIVSGEAWIIEGAYHLWVGPSLDRAQVILALVPSVWIRDARIVRRFIRRKWRAPTDQRISLRKLWSMIRWNHAYDHDTFPQVMSFIGGRGRTAVECRTVADVLAALDGKAECTNDP